MSLPDALEIIKKRWPEVILLAGLSAGLAILRREIWTIAFENAMGEQIATRPPDSITFFFGLGTMGCMIILTMLYLGFLRTASTDGCAPTDPGQLVRTGRYYFWRVARFYILIDILHIGLALVIMVMLAIILPKATKPEDVPMWHIWISKFLGLMLLSKVIAFTPAIMIGLDRMVVKSIGQLRQYSLLGPKRTLALCTGTFVIAAGVLFALDFVKGQGVLHYFLAGCSGAGLCLAMLVMHLEALRMVTFGLAPVMAEQDTGADNDSYEEESLE